MAERDAQEARRLALPPIDECRLHDDLVAGYAAAGFQVASVRRVAMPELAAWPSTWARRLAHGQWRPVFQVEARAAVWPAVI